MRRGGETREVIGRRVRELRLARELTRTRLALQLGIDAPSLARIERGERAIDTLLLRRLCEELGVEMWELFTAPEPSVIAHSPGAEEMIEWALELRRDLDFVAEFRRVARVGA